MVVLLCDGRVDENAGGEEAAGGGSVYRPGEPGTALMTESGPKLCKSNFSKSAQKRVLES